ncbi:MAG: heterodisulfide reductase-related iron-sulfur binding cluster [Methanomassiliicoccus sp.]|nr:heterodisulfide reductase-related iron-sulfur binding cluster [Methanomassiliicoccus sp.]
MTERVLDGCIKCGACVRVCPIIAQQGRDAFPGPRRLAVEAPRFDGELHALRSSLLLCTTCGRCEEVCPSRLPLPQALVRVRSLVLEGDERPEGQERMMENVVATGRTVVPSGPPASVPTTGDLMLFPGCIAHARLPETIVAALRLLRAAGARPYIPEGWACCGSPLEKIGASSLVETVKGINSRVLGVAKVVTTCPGCTVQLRTAHGMDAWHIIEHLHAVGGVPGDLFDPHAPPVRAALHRPCHLARVVGPHTMEMARDLLARVPGVEVVEYDGQDDCCGGGGGVASSRPEVAEAMARRKIGSARDAGADLLLAPCPFCVVNLRRAGGMEVQDLTVFLAERLGPGQNK